MTMNTTVLLIDAGDMRCCELIHCNLLAVGTYSTSIASAASEEARPPAPDILLRYQDSNTTHYNRIALDIGGTLTKVAFIASDTLEPAELHTASASYPEGAPVQQHQYKAHSAVNSVNKSGGVEHGGRLQFKLFDTACINEVVEFIAKFAVRGGNLGHTAAAAEGAAPVQVCCCFQLCILCPCRPAMLYFCVPHFVGSLRCPYCTFPSVLALNIGPC